MSMTSLATDSEPRSEPIPASVLKMRSLPLLTVQDELWLLSGRWRAHARQSERLAADAISKSSLIAGASLAGSPTTPDI